MGQKFTNPKSKGVECKGGSICECDGWHRLSQVMQTYDEENQAGKVNHIQLLDDFIHLLHVHDTDKEFEYIFDHLPSCQISQCARFQRCHHDNSDTSTHSVNMDANEAIIDKVHCYLVHSYDTALRLRAQQTSVIFTSHEDEKQEHVQEDDGDNLCNAVNSKLILLNEAIQAHKKTLSDACPTWADHRSRRMCDQLISHDAPQKEDEANVFHFGHAFNYDEDDELTLKVYGKVQPMYKSLKEEVISNQSACISVQQFDAELRKATSHYQTQYCKSLKGPQYLYADDFAYKEETKYIALCVEHVLALMIYCNFTELQFVFSSTYRTTNKRDHDAFYHWGKSLKDVRFFFGTAIRESNTHKFYHGLNSKFLFPRIYSAVENGKAILCPLSTTSALAVAVNFAGNNGVVIEFHNDHPHNTTYFGVDWLSDFPAERECLFIQNKDTHERLLIVNIIRIETGHEFEAILSAIRYINTVVAGFCRNLDERWAKLAVRIIHHRLSKSSASDLYRPFRSLTQYALELINNYFLSKHSKITLRYEKMKRCEDEHTSALFDVFWHAGCEWVKLENIVALFPNLKEVKIESAVFDFNAFMFKDMLNKLQLLRVQRIRWILQKNVKEPRSPVCDIHEFERQFADIGYKIDLEDPEHGYFWYLRVHRKDVTEIPTATEVLLQDAEL